MSGKVAEKDYFLDKEGNLAQSEEDAAFLLVREGQEMTAEQVEKIGSAPDSGKVAQEGDAAEADDVEAESAKAAKPASNKSAAPTKNKGAKK